MTKYDRKKACEALILSIINYGLCIYGRAKKIQDKLTVLINDAMRLVLEVKNPVDFPVVKLYGEMAIMSTMGAVRDTMA